MFFEDDAIAQLMKHPARKAVNRFLDSLGITYETIGRNEVWRLQQQWREHFARGVKEATGKWSLGCEDWYLLNEGYTAAVRGYRAEDAYSDALADTVIVLSSNPHVPGYRCSSKPTLVDTRQFITEHRWLYDLYLFPPDFRWTMVLVHEEEVGSLFANDSE